MLDEKRSLSETSEAELRSFSDASKVTRTLNRGESIEFDEAMEKKASRPGCTR